MKRYKVKVNSKEYIVEIEELDVSEDTTPKVAQPTQQIEKSQKAPVTGSQTTGKSPEPAGNKNVVAPMSGNILKVNCKTQDTIKKGDVLFVLEAMKMENEITSNFDGVISKIHVNEGDSVKTKQLLLELSE